MIINKYKNIDGLDCVVVDNQDGTFWSGLKSVYDAQQEALANGNNPVV